MVREGKELPAKYNGERGKKPRKLIILNDPENPENGFKFYDSINEASKGVGVNPMQIYKIIAEGCGMFLTSSS